MYVHTDLYMSVHNSIIHDISQKLKQFQMFNNPWMDKQNVVRPCNDILFSI